METVRLLIQDTSIVYSIAIFLVLLVSWVPSVLEKPILFSFYNGLKKITDPYLDFFRKRIPAISVGDIQLDLSPIVALLVLRFATSLVLWLLG